MRRHTKLILKAELKDVSGAVVPGPSLPSCWSCVSHPLCYVDSGFTLHNPTLEPIVYGFAVPDGKDFKTRI